MAMALVLQALHMHTIVSIMPLCTNACSMDKHDQFLPKNAIILFKLVKIGNLYKDA